MKKITNRLLSALLASALLLGSTGCALADPQPSSTPTQAETTLSTEPRLEATAPSPEAPTETVAATEISTQPPTEATSVPTEPTVTEPPVTEPPATEPPATEPPVTEPPVTAPPATEPPATEPPATEPPATNPLATEPPATEPPASQPPTTEPPASQPPTTEPPATQPPATEPISESDALANEAVQLPGSEAAIPNVTTAVASGTNVKSNSEAAIDYSNTGDGYVMVCYTGTTSQRLKVQVKGPATTYTYNLSPQQWTAFPLSDENGNYQITVYKNVVDSKYAAVLSLSISVTMKDEFAPYLCSNQFVNFDAAPNTVARAASLTGGISDPLGKVNAIYNFVVYGMTYDRELAATVTSGYVPNLDSVLAKMSGICFDYAALMTGMLRSQGVPTKLVVGYAGDAYHAWINVWSESTGWVDGAIYFDGVSWKRMDPTFASSGANEFVGNGSNYSAKYFY